MNTGTSERPCIRGIYVLAHLSALKRARGSVALAELSKRLGGISLDFDESDAVPVATEVHILEAIVDMEEGELPPHMRELKAGRLHFRNFSHTFLFRLLMPFVRFNLRLVLIRAAPIARRVFEGVTFVARDAGERSVRIMLMNNEYPVEHFQGFFEAVVEYAGFKPHIEARELSIGRYEYSVSW